MASSVESPLSARSAVRGPPVGALAACSFSDAGIPRRRSPYFRRHKGGGRVHEKSEATPRFLFYFSF